MNSNINCNFALFTLTLSGLSNDSTKRNQFYDVMEKNSKKIDYQMDLKRIKNNEGEHRPETTWGVKTYGELHYNRICGMIRHLLKKSAEEVKIENYIAVAQIGDNAPEIIEP